MRINIAKPDSKRFPWVAILGIAGIFVLSVFGLNEILVAQAGISGTSATTESQSRIPMVAWNPPDPATIPQGKLGDSIRLGRNIIIDTPKYASRYVGNKMKCADCHLNEGTLAYSSPLAGITTIFPAITERDARVITIERRIQECFVRSENGTPPPSDSPEMVAMVAYMNWLSKGIPMGSTVKGRGFMVLTPPARFNPAAGAKIYANQCQVCHGANGQGVAGMFPPLWGPGSFNDGAGMSKPAKMARFVKANMPKTSPGSLSVQQAYDVSAYVDSKPRPHFKPSQSASDWKAGR